ncbi:hypothetical protein V8C86DRAFT_2915542 [Haematococcus lacustris]
MVQDLIAQVEALMAARSSPSPRLPPSPSPPFPPSPRSFPPPSPSFPLGESAGISTSLHATAHVLGRQQWCFSWCAGHCRNPDVLVIDEPYMEIIPNVTTCSYTSSSACGSSSDYVYQIPPFSVDRSITISTCVYGVESWDTVLYVLNATSNACSCPSWLRRNDDFGDCGEDHYPNSSLVSFTALAGVPYTVVVEGYSEFHCGVPAISIDIFDSDGSA